MMAESATEKAAKTRKSSNNLSPCSYDSAKGFLILSTSPKLLNIMYNKEKRTSFIEEPIKLASKVPGPGKYQIDKAELKIYKPMRKF